MDAEVEDRIMSQSLQQFLDDTVVDRDMEIKFWENPTPDNGFLGLWMLSQILDRRGYHGPQELSHYREDFAATIKREQKYRTSSNLSNYKELDPFTDEQIDKFQWTFDVFLMEQASQYLE